MGIMVGVEATIRLVTGATMNVILLTPMPATLTPLRIGVMVGVTTAALGSIDCAMPSRIAQRAALLGLKAMHRC